MLGLFSASCLVSKTCFKNAGVDINPLKHFNIKQLSIFSLDKKSRCLDKRSSSHKALWIDGMLILCMFHRTFLELKMNSGRAVIYKYLYQCVSSIYVLDETHWYCINIWKNNNKRSRKIILNYSVRKKTKHLWIIYPFFNICKKWK